MLRTKLPYLSPDWVYNTDTHEFYNGKYLQRQAIRIRVTSCKTETWNMFKRHHYLSGDINKASDCYIATMNDIPVGFISILPFPRKNLHNGYREHRLVVLPDFQGMGIGNRLSEMVAQAYVDAGYKYFTKTSNPRIGIHRDNSILWRGTTHNHSARKDYLKSGSWKDEKTTKQFRLRGEKLNHHANRVCYCHEYVGLEGSP